MILHLGIGDVLIRSATADNTPIDVVIFSILVHNNVELMFSLTFKLIYY